MTREEKSVAINEILDVLKSNQNIYLTDISGLNALETSNLRRMCFKAGVKLSVVKNTLLEKAMDNSEKDFGELKETLKGNTSVMIAEVSSAPAKVIKNFRKKSERPILKGAMIEEDIYIGDDQLETLFSIKSKEELIGDIIMLLQSPAKNVISALSSSGGKISGILQTLSKSISISGILILSGLRNLSKSRSYFIGSIFVIHKQYATTDPAADPLPGPTDTFISLAFLIKSSTIKK